MPWQPSCSSLFLPISGTFFNQTVFFRLPHDTSALPSSARLRLPDWLLFAAFICLGFNVSRSLILFVQHSRPSAVAASAVLHLHNTRLFINFEHFPPKLQIFKFPASKFVNSRQKLLNFPPKMRTTKCSNLPPKFFKFPAPKFLNFPPNFSNFPRQNFKFRAKIQKIRGQRQRLDQIPVRRADERMRNVAAGGRPPHRIREHPVRSERRAGHGSVGHGPADQLLVAEPADQECALQSVFRQRGGCGGCPGGW